MFGFFKKKSEDEGVLTNLKTVSRWLESLPTGDIYSAQEKVVQHLILFNHSDQEQGYTKDRLQVLMHLDEKTREMQDSLGLQYLRNSRMSKSLEVRLWTAIHAFYWEVTRGYHSFLMDFIANPGGSKIQALIPQITVRGIRGFADIIKWRYFRYEKMDDKLWLRMHNLYRIAEFDRFAGTPVTAYPGELRQRTAAEEYGQALLLSPFGSGNLLPREIEMVDQWLDNWSNRIRIDTAYKADRHAFYVDTGKGQGVRRCTDVAADANLRYLATQELLARIEEVREALGKGTAPVNLGLTEDFRVPEGYSLLKQVEAAWAMPGEDDRRRGPRLPQDGRWRVIHGLANICTELSKAEFGGNTENSLSNEEMLDIRLYGFVTERTKERLQEQERETRRQHRQDVWEQRDVSESGIAFRVDPRDSEWVKIGKLVAIAPFDEERWNIGIVSRLASQDKDNRLVGVKLLTSLIQAVQLKADDIDTTRGYTVDEMDQVAADPQNCALLLHDGEQKRLIIDSARYSRDRRYLLRPPKADSQVIRLETVEDTGESWLKVDFNVVAV